ncbi:MAG: hypothetical protein WC223_05055 [Bacteroidales bacterium]|jgi:hypothetical protein
MTSKIRAILKSYGYKIFTRPYEMNIVGIRNINTIANRFDDEIHVFYKVNTLKWDYYVFKATTDPGTFWLENPMQPQGTAILAQGQYINAYQIGLHRGLYEALVQCAPVTIIRDYDRDAYLDFFNDDKATGVFGINIHRALIHGSAKYVDNFSAGCQVFENGDDFAKFMLLCGHHSMLYGNKFTYTLIDFRALQRTTRRKLIAGGMLALGASVATWAWFNE